MGTEFEREANLFNFAREIPAGAEREALLLRECGDDLAKLTRIRKMLSAYDSDPSYLSTLLGTGFALNDGATLAEQPGDRIGPYVLQSVLGEGGMGIVFQAEQTHPFRRSVALKVIKPGMDSRQIVARFEAERQALAVMDHANIARVYDAGTTATGRSYFVMELIAGKSITRYCDDCRLCTDDRLRLFQSVCDAVEHAHQKGIIHRDIKPNNVLVAEADGKPLVKVIDFGVAKALHEGQDRESLYTMNGQLLGTLEYMSPEQASAKPQAIGARTDVYGLGILLYELLTGVTPFETKRLRLAEFNEARRIICEEEPVRPSARMQKSETASTAAGSRKTIPSHLQRTLSHDLDWVVMKAIEKEPERRYDSVSGLSSDISRYLKHEPVSATPPSWSYRLRKLYERNRVAVRAVIAILLALTIGLIVAVWQAFEARHAERLAIASERQSEQRMDAAVNAMEQLLKHVSDPRLSDPDALQEARLKILRDAMDFYEQFSAETGVIDRLHYRAAVTFRMLGHLARDLGDDETASTAFAKALRFAHELLSRTDAPEHRETLALLHLDMGKLLAGSTRLSDTQRAKEHLASAVQHFYQLALAHPHTRRYSTLQCEAMTAQASIYIEGNQGVWISMLDEPAIEIENLYARCDPSVAVLHFLADWKSQLGDTSAQELFDRAVDLAKRHATPQRENCFERATLFHRAAREFVCESPSRSEFLWSECLALCQSLVQQFPTIVKYSELEVEVTSVLSNHLAASGRLKEALSLSQRLVERTPGSESFHRIRADLLVRGVDHSTALKRLEAACVQHPHSSAYSDHRADLHEVLGNWSDAIQDLTRAIDQANGESAARLLRRGSNYARMRNWPMAIADYSRAIEIAPQSTGPYANRARAYLLMREYGAALADLRQAIAFEPHHAYESFQIVSPLLAVQSGDSPFIETYSTLLNQHAERLSETEKCLLQSQLWLALGDKQKGRHAVDYFYYRMIKGEYELHKSLLVHELEGRSAFRKRCWLRLFADAEPVARQKPWDAFLLLWKIAVIPSATDEYFRTLAIAKKWRKQYPENRAIAETLAALHYRAGNFADARREFEASANLRDQRYLNPVLRDCFVAMTEARLGNSESAAVALQRAQLNALRSDPLVLPSYADCTMNALLQREAADVVAHPQQAAPVVDPPMDPYGWYLEAVSALDNDNVTEYRRICRDMVRRFETASDEGVIGAEELYPVAWAVCLLPEGDNDSELLSDFLERTTNAELIDRNQGLSAGLLEFRRGRYEQADALLTRAEALKFVNPGSAGYVWYYRAMVRSQLGRLAEAEEDLRAANACFDAEWRLADWAKRRLLTLMRTEATKLVSRH